MNVWENVKFMSEKPKVLFQKSDTMKSFYGEWSQLTYDHVQQFLGQRIEIFLVVFLEKFAFINLYEKGFDNTPFLCIV